MSEPADREGDFRCEIVDYAIQQAKAPSQAVMVRLKVKLTHFYQPTEIGGDGEWHPWEEYDQEAYGSVCVAKKDGSLNQTGCESLMNNAGWDGDFSAVDNKTWKPTRCQVRLSPNEYHGKTTYQVAFVNGYDDTPGGGSLKSVGSERAKALQDRFGSSLRAIKGTLKTNAAPASGKPKSPSPPKSVPVAAAATSENGAPPVDEVPF